MLHIYEEDPESDANDYRHGTSQDGQLGRDSSSQLSLSLHLPKNRSTGNLALPVDTPAKARFRLSFDAGAAAADYDAMAQYAHSHWLLPVFLSPASLLTFTINSSPIMTDHDHGLGRSGLRRIRQHVPMRAPTLPSSASSRASSIGLPRSSSMTTMLQSSRTLSPKPSCPAFTTAFTEDLSRFSSESLHSFSFAHQSEELLHNRQSVLKRSVEFMQDRMGWPASSNAGLASAQARASGDLETQNMLDLLARAQLVGAGNLPNSDPNMIIGPLSGPPSLTNENVFDKSFIPRTASPEQLSGSETAPNSALPSPVLLRTTAFADNSVSPLQGSPVASPVISPSSGGGLQVAANQTSGPSVYTASAASDSAESSRTPTNESGTTQKTSPPASRHPSLLLRRSMTDIAPVVVQQRLIDTLARSYVPGSVEAQTTANYGVLATPGENPYDLASSPHASLQPLASPLSMPGNLGSAVHSHTSRWVPAAQAIFTTEAKPPWTIIAANDLACLVFGVTKAEVRKMGILEVVQEERRAWLEKKLLHADPDDPGDLGDPGEDIAGIKDEGDGMLTEQRSSASSSISILGSRGGGITAKLLSKPNSRTQTPQGSSQHRLLSLQGKEQQRLLQARRANTIHGGEPKPPKPAGSSHHHHTNSRGVLLCGDVVPIQKRNGATGSASLWVKEKRIGLIWVLEEIHEDVATVVVDDDGSVVDVNGSLGSIWGDETMQPGVDIGKLVPRIPRLGFDTWSGPVDFAEVERRKYYTCRNCDRINIPATVERVSGQSALRISSFPHIAGIIVVSTKTLAIRSSNSVFAGALFGYEMLNGYPINQLIPDFDKILQILTDVDNIHLVDGMVVPEHSFRKASAFLALREGRPDASTAFLRPEGLPAHHRDGSELKIDVQMRVVKSEKRTRIHEETVVEEDEENEEDESTTASSSLTGDSAQTSFTVSQSEMVYALWITYSRHLHATRQNLGIASPLLSGFATPLHQPSPGQTPNHSPTEMMSPQTTIDRRLQMSPRSFGEQKSVAQALTRQLEDVAMKTAREGDQPGTMPSILSQMSVQGATPKATVVAAAAGSMPALPLPGATAKTKTATSQSSASTATIVPTASASAMATTMTTATTGPGSTGSEHKKTIDDFTIVEEMGQGAYGQVKLARYKSTGKKVIIKYVTKRRILVDTWTRDRRLGTVPLEIHVLDYLRRDGLQHPNIVEMEDFFEDDVNYYIEMVPHGLPGMDLFDYIELRRNMEESECQCIFVQVAQAIHHLHTKAMVVHRDIKDENVVLDGDGHIRLIDFGSAAYIKSGPFDVFVGTIDYAAPEVLAGRPYGGKEQDVWALGILLYTIIYKENPFYSIDEIMDRDLRVPYTISDDSIDLIRHMLDRDVAQRYSIVQVLDHPWCQKD
ncbi:serine/threonine-protein kinase ppk6 [Grosmannia clavigera kw1407]|uniref:non-specific serine/threonine protein kinase n=1 Tax=Grosmannia clavigera (strain kw1407 / UAMH 11150) TaxID=655863 RepID=F0XQ63_GROCL|nr:serine/threonine-protein kinase ppk6 [Grosmannia clavigera kw1407]EFX00123.1 serine/threonine-protein kinase ppk6 [Grosmannia clavigera kw1407]